jgi:hypothetical protein
MTRSPAIPALALVAASGILGCGRDHTSGAPIKQAANMSIASSIAEGATLTQPVGWEARMSDVPVRDIVKVRFLIDGRLRHVERKTPYVFAGLGNRLLPGTLGPGSHTFAVDAQLRSGRRLTTASTANVSRSAQGVPPEVIGRWIRTVTPAAVRRTARFRIGVYGEALPVGTWKLEITADGVARYTDPTASHGVSVGQVRFARGGPLVVGNEIPNFPNAAEGGFCPDTVEAGTYRWRVQRGALVISVVRDHQCADRNSFWSGPFTRSEG